MLSGLFSHGLCQEPDRQNPDKPQVAAAKATSFFRVKKEDRQRVLAKLEAALVESYFRPDLGEKMAVLLRDNAERGKYDAIESPEIFARTLTQDLFEVTRDRHLDVFYAAQPASTYQAQASKDSPGDQKRADGATQNYGFEKLERLPGNIGYLDLRGFWAGEPAEKTAAAAMAFLENSAAVIIDLRENKGGRPSMLALLVSYFSPRGRRLHILDIRTRAATEQLWTNEKVPAPSLGEKDVYVLTSRRTFSAGEGLAYTLQAHQRAIVIGEVSGGGANPAAAPVELDKDFAAVIPHAQISSPVTGGNWEGSGVKPDVEVAAEIALKTAHLAALAKLAKGQPPDAETQTAMKALRQHLRSKSE